MSGLKQYQSLDDCKQRKKAIVTDDIVVDPVDQCMIYDYVCYRSTLLDNIILVGAFVVLREISERAEWIKEMEEIGEDKKYRAIIRAEIAERLNRIKHLDKSRGQNEQTIWT